MQHLIFEKNASLKLSRLGATGCMGQLIYCMALYCDLTTKTSLQASNLKRHGAFNIKNFQAVIDNRLHHDRHFSFA